MHLYDSSVKFWLVGADCKSQCGCWEAPSPSPWAGREGGELGSRRELEKEQLSHPEQCFCEHCPSLTPLVVAGADGEQTDPSPTYKRLQVSEQTFPLLKLMGMPASGKNTNRQKKNHYPTPNLAEYSH